MTIPSEQLQQSQQICINGLQHTVSDLANALKAVTAFISSAQESEDLRYVSLTA